MKRLTLRFHVGAFTGYHALSNAIFDQLTKRGIFCSVRKIAIDEQWGKSSAISKEMRSQIVDCRQPEEWEFLIAPPDQNVTPDRKTVWMSMFESSEMPPQYVSLLSRSEQVITPCRWNSENFAKNGLRVPIETIPLGFDPEIYRPTPISESGPTVIGIAGRTRHCAKRKGVQEAIDLFLKTFRDDDTIRLHVKLHPDDIITDPKDHRVKIVKQHFEEYEIARWIHGLTAYMTLSRGEGFSLWPLHCMASGRPVIGASYGGQAEFMTKENSFVVPHREVDADSGESNVQYLGQWAKLDEKAASSWMRVVHRDRKFAIDRAQVAVETVQHLTWDAMGEKLVNTLERIGVWK